MIVCLGWGSLIWDPKLLPLADPRPEAWRDDGPELPIEFTRVSGGARLTLVVDAEAAPIQVLWNELAVPDLSAAIEALRSRERTKRSWIGRWSNGNGIDCFDAVAEWARSRDLAGVVWSAMPSKFNGQDYVRPSQTEALDYLARLEGEMRRDAEEYIRRAPTKIDTPYRRAIEKALGWTPQRAVGQRS